MKKLYAGVVALACGLGIMASANIAQAGVTCWYPCCYKCVPARCVNGCYVPSYRTYLHSRCVKGHYNKRGKYVRAHKKYWYSA